MPLIPDKIVCTIRLFVKKSFSIFVFFTMAYLDIIHTNTCLNRVALPGCRGVWMQKPGTDESFADYLNEMIAAEPE
jgi:hypothetical protein